MNDKNAISSSRSSPESSGQARARPDRGQGVAQALSRRHVHQEDEDTDELGKILTHGADLAIGYV